MFSANAPVVPFAVVGVRDNENLFVDNEWRLAGRPLRPGVRASLPVHLLASAELGPARAVRGRGVRITSRRTSTQPFFVDGKPSENLQRALKFNQMYHANLQDTRAFGEWLEKNGMLEEKMARAELPQWRRPTRCRASG